MSHYTMMLLLGRHYEFLQCGIIKGNLSLLLSLSEVFISFLFFYLSAIAEVCNLLEVVTVQLTDHVPALTQLGHSLLRTDMQMGQLYVQRLLYLIRVLLVTVRTHVLLTCQAKLYTD
jgi:hypothetical protein